MTVSRKRPEVAVPKNMESLELTEKGYLNPWFVKADDFRVVDGDKAWLAVSKQNCWVCGNPFIENEFAMVGDAVTAMVRICTEPPCHKECAVYALQVCPFILYPNAKRREAGLDEEEKLAHNNKSREVKINEANPGKYYLVVVKDFRFVQEDQLMYFNESDIIERQYWIGGEKQKSIPDPILRFEDLDENLQKIYLESNC